MAPPLRRRLTQIQRRLTQIMFLSSVICHLSSVCYAQSQQYVRVQVMQGLDSLSLKAEGNYTINGVLKDEVLAKGRDLKTTVTTYRGGILIAGKSFPADKLFIRTRDPDNVVINGRTFRGDLLLVKEGDKISAVNYLELEDYVKGISIREISHYWPPEAIKASVIVFRTFVLYKAEEGAGRDFDLTSDIYSQVYSGQNAERYRINKAVDETKGEVIFYKSKVLPAFYHATCAGHTEDAEVLWNIDLAPLKGVVCPFCKDSPHFRWHLVLTLDEIKEKLAQGGYKIPEIKDIAILGHNPSGRITDLKIVSGKKELKIPAKDFRNIIGPNLIKSTNFSVTLINHDVVFEGFGWGHGVGLCQWGAYFMAKQGHDYKDILKYYYPGSDVKNIGF